MDELMKIGAQALRKAALNEEAKHFVLNNETLFRTFKKAADRYIGGETLGETVLKVMAENNNGFKCSIEFMGENIQSEAEANEATEEFINICHAIEQKKLYATVSLDLSHIGLGISPELGMNNLSQICQVAGDAGIEVIISAEGTEQTDEILNAYKEVAKKHSNLSITMQAYLYRSKDDFKELLNYAGRIRVVKGAFDTAAGLSMPRGKELNDTYLEYIDTLLSNGHKCSIATHHHEIQQEAKKLIQLHKPERANYEFESLYGIQTAQLLALKEEGFMTKMYFVYGREWYLYLCNRIAEHPVNLFRALADITG